MKGKLKSINEATIDSDFVSAKDFKRLYEVHLKALVKIEDMEAENKRLSDDLEQMTETANEYARIIQSK